MPFGPSAHAVASALLPDDDAGPAPAGADDFWGEDSAAIQAAMQPSAHPAGDARRSTEVDPRALRHAPRTSHARRARGASAAVGLVAGLVLIASVIGSVISSVIGSGPPAKPRKVQQRAALPLPASIDAPRSKPSRVLSQGRSVSRQRPGVGRHTRRPVHRAVKRVRSSTPRTSAPSRPAVVTHYSPAPAGSAPVQSVPDSQSRNTSSAPSTASASGETQTVVHTSSARPGPTGPVSLIGSGTSPSG